MGYFKQMFKKYDKVNGVVKENVGAIRVVKAFVREDYEDKKFSDAAGEGLVLPPLPVCLRVDVQPQRFAAVGL